MMKVERYNLGLIGTNCYFLVNENTKEMLVIDPGDNGKELAKNINETGKICKGILITHGHADHTHGMKELKESLGDVKIYALDKEKELLLSPKLNASSMMGYGDIQYEVDEYLTDGQEMELAGLKFKVIATPGHTPGGCCYYFYEENILFTGDTLFSGSVGRTDFPRGDYNELSDSIKNKLYVLPDDTKVFPGHMGLTSIGIEKQSNLYIR